MSYNGSWLIKVGDYVIPNKYIAMEKYKAYTNMQDVDPWTDANGYLHRTAVSLKALKVELTLRALLTDTQFQTIMGNIRSQYLVSKERRLKITAYIPETGAYETQYGYLADFEPTIYNTTGNVIKYNEIELHFIGGVYND